MKRLSIVNVTASGFLHSFLLNRNQRSPPFSVRSPLVFYPLRRYENKWDFHQLMSTKSKIHSRRFCSHLFSSICLDFNWRIYEYGAKVKLIQIILQTGSVSPNRIMPNHRKKSRVKSELPNYFKSYCRKILFQITEHNFFDYLCKSKYSDLWMVTDLE